MSALERAIEILGEAAARVPKDLRDRHPDLPWREMIGTRNRLAHAYFATELFILHGFDGHDMAQETPVLLGAPPEDPADCRGK